MAQLTYQTLEELQQRKNELQAQIHQDGELIGDLWHELAAPKKSSSKGELIANLVSNSITAIDAFILVRKLMKNYGHLFSRKRK